jgi:hypothetical protein
MQRQGDGEFDYPMGRQRTQKRRLVTRYRIRHMGRKQRQR